MTDPTYSEFEKGERQALLEVRSFIATRGTKEVDAFCAQRLHDIMMDARPRRQQQPRMVVKRGPHGPLVYPE